jgi:hypothetical protein
MSDLTPTVLAHQPPWQIAGIGMGVIAVLGIWPHADQAITSVGHLAYAFLGLVAVWRVIRSWMGGPKGPNALVAAGQLLMRLGQTWERVRPGTTTESKNP